MRERWTARDIPDQTGRVVVVTGANSGLGLAIARALAGAGAHVIMACRNLVKAETAAETITAEHPEGSVEVVQVDLGDLGSVARFADTVLDRHERVDVLANNAGLMALPRSLTADGFETHFGVNHLGHFALTARLLPAMVDTPGSRVVTMSSLGHRPAKLRLGDPMGEHRYSRWGAYLQSKLANLLFTDELQRRLARQDAATIAVAAHPGFSHTDIGSEDVRLLGRLAEPVGRFVAMPPEVGALPFLRAATAPTVTGGSFWGPRFYAWGRPVEERPARRARNTGDARALWALSEELTGLRFPG